MKSIKKIVIEVGGVELSLAPEDAKDLWKALNELFAKPTITITPSPQYVPYPVYPRQWPDTWIRYMSAPNTDATLKMGHALTLSGVKFLGKTAE